MRLTRIILTLLAGLAVSGCDRIGRKGKKTAPEPAGPVAVGKLVITPPALEIAKGSAYDAGEGFIEQQIEILGGPALRKTAEESLRQSQADLKPAPVAVQVARVKGSNIVSVIGRGDSPDYSAALIDALMEAYVATVQPAESAGMGKASNERDAAEKGLKDAERAWNTFRLEHDVARLNTDLSAAERRQKRLAVARSYYEQELDYDKKLTLEQDVRRRQGAPAIPSEMPAELAALVRTTLTVGELAYLSALKGTNAPAMEAARKEAEKDRLERAASNQKQLEIALDLADNAAKEIAQFQSLGKQATELQARLRTAESVYLEKKRLEKNLGAGMNDSVHPMVSITERAVRPKGAVAPALQK